MGPDFECALWGLLSKREGIDRFYSLFPFAYHVEKKYCIAFEYCTNFFPSAYVIIPSVWPVFVMWMKDSVQQQPPICLHLKMGPEPDFECSLLAHLSKRIGSTDIAQIYHKKPLFAAQRQLWKTTPFEWCEKAISKAKYEVSKSRFCPCLKLHIEFLDRHIVCCWIRVHISTVTKSVISHDTVISV